MKENHKLNNNHYLNLLKINDEKEYDISNDILPIIIPYIIII